MASVDLHMRCHLSALPHHARTTMNSIPDVLRTHGLSKAEVRVGELVAKGLKSKDIGDQLEIKESSVKFHLTSIYRKCGVKQRAQFIRKVLEGAR